MDGIFLHLIITSTAGRIEFLSDRISHIVLKDPWCDTVVINAHAEVLKESLYTKLDPVFN